MNKLTSIGAWMFIIGLVLIILLSFLPLFDEGFESGALIVVKVCIGLMLVGGVLILISLIKERVEDDKEVKKIGKEALKP